MRTAAKLFSRTATCDVKPSRRSAPPVPPTPRRQLLRHPAAGSAGRGLAAAEAPGAGVTDAAAAAAAEPTDAGAPAEHVPVEAPEESGGAEVGDERVAQDALWAEGIYAKMKANLAAQGWLGGFEPLCMHCPLLARKVSREAVPQFADAAWRCDGLGFAWECLGV